jgi:hypothetical protein
MEARGSERKPERGPASWTARVVAPVVLIVAAVAIIMIVNASFGGGSDDEEGAGERQATTTTADGCQPEAPDAVEAGYFVIEPGDDLSIVADRTCIAIDQITELNPNLDPQLIQPGNCVDLRIDGCKALAGEP